MLHLILKLNFLKLADLYIASIILDIEFIAFSFFLRIFPEDLLLMGIKIQKVSNFIRITKYQTFPIDKVFILKKIQIFT
jgi:hypothetical protein